MYLHDIISLYAQELNINVSGVNILGCVDPSTLLQCLKYKQCKLEFTSTTNERQEELLKAIQASTGIVVENASSSEEGGNI